MATARTTLVFLVIPKTVFLVIRKMAKKSRRRRKRGRPATGRDPVVTVRLTPQLRRALALISEKHRMTKSAAIRCLLNAGIEHSYLMTDPKRNVDYIGETPGVRQLSRGIRARAPRRHPSPPAVPAYPTIPPRTSTPEVDQVEIPALTSTSPIATERAGPFKRRRKIRVE
jgi:hypothetical protein